MRFLFIGSRFTLHASFPHSVTLMQLRFALLTVTSSQRDLHPQVCAHAGRTKQKPPLRLAQRWFEGTTQGSRRAASWAARTVYFLLLGADSSIFFISTT